MIAIVGGGLAGTSLSKIFYENQIEFEWYLDEKPSASHISSGIINPVSGRKYSLAWKYEELTTIAQKFYGDCCKEVKIEKKFEAYTDGISIDEIIQNKENYLRKINEDWIEVSRSYQVSVPKFIRNWQEKLSEKITIFKEKFEYSLLKNQRDDWHYKSKIYSKIIFAEGIFVLDNPYFNYIDFRPNRGEAISLEIKDFEQNPITKFGKYICPFEGKHWIGSSFDNIKISDPVYTETEFTKLKDNIPQLVGQHSYENIKHLGAIRSTTYDRKPIIGEHPKEPNLYVFNGFGAKGTSLIPYCSIQLFHHILDGENLDSEISITRLKK